MSRLEKIVAYRANGKVGDQEDIDSLRQEMMELKRQGKTEDLLRKHAEIKRHVCNYNIIMYSNAL